MALSGKSGFPVTMTSRLKDTEKLITCPAPYSPDDTSTEILSIVGRLSDIPIDFDEVRDWPVPSAGKARFASRPNASSIE